MYDGICRSGKASVYATWDEVWRSSKRGHEEQVQNEVHDLERENDFEDDGGEEIHGQHDVHGVHGER